MVDLADRIEQLVGEAYEIGHAHGSNRMRMFQQLPPLRVDDGWGPIAEEILQVMNNWWREWGNNEDG